MQLNDDRDYLIGIILPSLLDEPLEEGDIAGHFTASESKKLQLQSLPAKLNHANGEKYEIGTVLASASTGVSGRVLMELNADGPQAAYASKSIAAGHYRGLSLGHGFHKRFSDSGGQYVRKQAREVSVCQRGARPGSVIEQFFPSERTLANLNDADLRTMVSLYDYEREMADQSVAANSRPQYIRKLHKLVKQRRNKLIAQNNLEPSARNRQTPLPNYTVASIYMSETAEANAAPDVTQTTDAMSNEAAQNKPTTEQEPPAPSAVDSPIAQNSNMAKELVETQRQLVELQERQVEMLKVANERKAELDAIRNKEAERKEKERADAVANAERAIESFRQNAKKHGAKDDQINSQVNTFREYAKNDPIGAPQHINGVTEMMVLAAHTQREQNATDIRNAVERMQKDDDSFFKRNIPELSLLHERMKVAKEAEQQLLNESRSQSSFMPTGASTPAMPDATSAQQQATPMTGIHNASANSTVQQNVQRRSKMDEFVHQCNARGVIPSYDETRNGLWRSEYGEVHASANGFQPDRVVPHNSFELRSEQPNFGMQEWSEEIYSEMLRAGEMQKNRGVVIAPTMQ